MASIANSFDLLVGAENTLSKKQKKKQNKAKADAAAAAVVSSTVAPTATPTVSTNKPTQQGGVVDASEAKAIFERAAREAKTIADKVKLWRDWIKQVQDKTGKGLKYKDAQGQLVDFQQVLLDSRALEISIEGAVGSGLSQDRGDVLAQLLGAFFPHLGHPHTLASLLVRLSVLVEDDAIDTKGAAQRAVFNALSAVKLGEQSGAVGSNDGASAASAWLNSIHKLDKEIAQDQQLLAKLLQSSGGVVSKEQATMAKGIYKKLEERFDLLQPSAVPSTASGNGAGRDALTSSVQELKKVVTAHLREVAPDSAASQAGGKAGAAHKAGGPAANATAAGIRREEQLLASQAEQVAGQIRTLEAQLRSLRSQAAEIEEKRASLVKRSGKGGAAAGGEGGKGARALPASHYREELELADALVTAVDPAGARGGLAAQVASAAAAAAAAPLEYVQGGQRALELARTVMAELPAKVASCKQRQVQAEKLLKLGAKDAGRVKGDVDRLMNDTLRNAEELLRGSLQIVSELNTRYEVVARVAPEQAVSAAAVLRAVDGLMADVRAGYEQVQAANRGPEAPAAPAPVPAASAAVEPPHARPMSAAPAPASAAMEAPPLRPLSAMPVAPGPVAPAAPAPAPAPVEASAAGSKSAFDAAAAYLAQAKAPAPKPATTSAPAAKPVAARAAPAAPAAAPRTWGKVATPAPAAEASEDASMPSLAEAYKAPAASEAGPSAGPSAAKKKANRQKA